MGALAAGKGGRILVVDDEPMVRSTLGRVLTDEGYVVDAAVDGHDALALARVARPDAILLDLMMPGMNGRQFLRAVRADPEFVHIPVVIMTAVHGLEVNLSTFGADAVVEKPFDVDDLLNKVALAVYRSREALEPAATMTSPIADEQQPEPTERGVVVVVERDRAQLQRLDVALGDRGFSVVSMTRAVAQVPRLARALHPIAILLEESADGVAALERELADTSIVGALRICVFSRGPSARGDVLANATDDDLVDLVGTPR